MSRLFRNCLALSFILAISLLAITKTHLANQATLKLTVRVYNYARVSETILAQAEKEASRIFREIGVQILWLQCPLSGIEEQLVTGCQSESDSTSLILRIIPRFAAATAGLRNEALGFALPSQEGGMYASIFYHRGRRNSSIRTCLPVPDSGTCHSARNRSSTAWVEFTFLHRHDACSVESRRPTACHPRAF